MKNEEDDAEVRQIETLRHRRSQLEVKFFFTENLKNEGTGTIRLEHRFDHFIFSSHQSPLFPLFISQRRQVLTNEEKQFSLETFFTRPHICN